MMNALLSVNFANMFVEINYKLFQSEKRSPYYTMKQDYNHLEQWQEKLGNSNSTRNAQLLSQNNYFLLPS